MKKIMMVVMLVGLATASSAYSWWPFSSAPTEPAEEPAKMTSYEATMAMRKAFEVDLLTEEELDRLVKNGADINFEFPCGYEHSQGTLLDMAYTKNMPLVAKMLENKGAKVTHAMLMTVVALVLAEGKMLLSDEKMIKAYGAREEITLAPTIKTMIIEEQAKSAEQCKKMKEYPYLIRECTRAHSLAFMQKVLITDKELQAVGLQVAQAVPVKK